MVHAPAVYRTQNLRTRIGARSVHETFSLVKGEVAAEEQEPIRVMGLSRPVQTYKVNGTTDERVDQGRILRAEKDGIRLHADLSQQDRATAIKTVQDLLSKLKG